MTDLTKMKEYREGYQDHVAYCMNTRAVANPYHIDGPQWHAYEAGWKESQEDAKAEDAYERALYGE